MKANVTWRGKLSFDGAAGSGFNLPLGTDTKTGGDDDGFRPMELLLMGLAGCTAMDVIAILAKKQQDVTHFEVRVDGQRASEHPRVFTHITVEYLVTGHKIDPGAVDRAIELSATKYCSVQAMLGKIVPIEIKTTILEAD